MGLGAESASRLGNYFFFANGAEVGGVRERALGPPTHPLAHRGAWRRRAGRVSSEPPLNSPSPLGRFAGPGPLLVLCCIRRITYCKRLFNNSPAPSPPRPFPPPLPAFLFLRGPCGLRTPGSGPACDCGSVITTRACAFWQLLDLLRPKNDCCKQVRMSHFDRRLSFVLRATAHCALADRTKEPQLLHL
jgi:hypothetical protein